MITHKGPLTTEEFMAWLKDGKDMLTVKRPKTWVCFLKVPTRDGIDYIFHQDGNQRPQSLLSPYANFRSTGFYKQDEQKLYCPNIPACAVPGWKNDPTTTAQSLRIEFCKDVGKSIEDMVNNDSADIPKGLTDNGLRADTAGYEDYIEHHVVPRIGSIKLTKLTGRDIQKLYNDVKANGRIRVSKDGNTGMSASYVRGLHMMLHNCLGRAVKERLILRNPTEDCIVPKLEKKEIHILHSEDISAYLREAEKRGVLISLFSW